MSYRFDLSGKVAVVTGSTKGLGRAMVQGLAEAGADLVMSSRRQEACETVAAEVNSSTGRRALGLACHIGEWEMVPSFVDGVMAALGLVDILVNNVGINPNPPAIVVSDLAVPRNVFAVNFEGPLRLSQLVAPHMREQSDGAIINIARSAPTPADPATSSTARRRPV